MAALREIIRASEPRQRWETDRPVYKCDIFRALNSNTLETTLGWWFVSILNHEIRHRQLSAQLPAVSASCIFIPRPSAVRINDDDDDDDDDDDENTVVVVVVVVDEEDDDDDGNSCIYNNHSTDMHESFPWPNW